MNNLIPAIHNRRKELFELLETVQTRLMTAPQGSLRVSFHGKTPQFYQAMPGQTRKPRYLGKKEHALAINLGQKDYDIKLEKSLSKEIRLLDSLIRFYESNAPEDVLDRLPAAKASIITPAFPSNEEFIKQWLSVSFTGLPFPDEASVHYTQRGERVRSKSEVLIADLLYKHGIPYRYEYPIRIKSRTVHPDFCIMKMSARKEIIWEHFGLLNDHEYRENFLTKLASYTSNGYFPGINLIMTFESAQQPLNSKMVARMIDAYCR